jgi:hypothetical protein
VQKDHFDLQAVFIIIIIVLGVLHCSIYKGKGSYNVSNMSYLTTPQALLHPLPQFLEQFQRVSFFAFLHVYTLFAPYSNIHPATPFPSPPTLQRCHPPNKQKMVFPHERSPFYTRKMPQPYPQR